MKIEDAVTFWNLDERMKRNLLKAGIGSFFPVQTSVIPLLLFSKVNGCIIPRDICVSAPTGSGKTLAYVLPIVQALLLSTSDEITEHALRALIVLPSRELAVQVHEVMNLYLEGLVSKNGTPILVCGVATGAQQFEREQKQFVCNTVTANDKLFSNSHLYASESTPKSLIDILVCTPGRLLEHIECTPGFSLKQLEYLVLDEADRLLSNASHYWIKSMLIKQSSSSSLRLQRLLFSATLSDDPSKLTLLGIRNPLIVHINQLPVLSDGNMSTPNGITNTYISSTTSTKISKKLLEYICVVETKVKPLYLVCMLHNALFNPQGHQLHSKLNGCLKTLKNEDESEDLNSKLEVGGIPSGVGTNHVVRSDDIGVCLVFVSSVETGNRLYKLLHTMNVHGHMLNARDSDDGEESGSSGSDTCSNSDASGDEESVAQSETEASSAKLDHIDATDEDDAGLEVETPEGDCDQLERSDCLFDGRVEYISSGLSASARERIMNQLRNQSSGSGTQAADVGKLPIRVIVASDQMARGIDIPNVRLVINYDPPTHSKTYVHRVGRTARAAKSGICVSILKAGGQVGSFKKMRMELEANSKKRKMDIFDAGDDSVESDKLANSTPYLHKFTPTSESITLLQPYYKYILKNLFK